MDCSDDLQLELMNQFCYKRFYKWDSNDKKEKKSDNKDNTKTKFLTRRPQYRLLINSSVSVRLSETKEVCQNSSRYKM